MLNKVLLIGKVTRCSLDYLTNGTALLKFTLRTWNGTSQFHEIVFFDEKVESSIRYLDAFTKQDKPYVYVEGTLSYRTVELKDGTKRRYANVVARTIRVLYDKPKETEEVPADLDKEDLLVDVNSSIESLPEEIGESKEVKEIPIQAQKFVQKETEEKKTGKIKIKEKKENVLDVLDVDLDIPPIDEDSLPF